MTGTRGALLLWHITEYGVSPFASDLFNASTTHPLGPEGPRKTRGHS